jgi:hypothetical protein
MTIDDTQTLQFKIFYSQRLYTEGDSEITAAITDYLRGIHA